MQNILIIKTYLLCQTDFFLKFLVRIPSQRQYGRKRKASSSLESTSTESNTPDQSIELDTLDQSSCLSNEDASSAESISLDPSPVALFTIDELKTVVMPHESGWNWWAPGFKCPSERQYLNEVVVEKQLGKVAKTIMVDLQLSEAVLLIPGIAYAEVKPFNSIRMLQAILDGFNKVELCKGIDDARFNQLDESKAGKKTDGVWRSERYN